MYNLFGSCQEDPVEAIYSYNPSREQLQDLRDDITELVADGYGWRDDVTQATIGGHLNRTGNAATGVDWSSDPPLIDPSPQYGVGINNAFLEAVQSASLAQVVHSPTRGSNILDLALVSDPGLVEEQVVVDGDKSKPVKVRIHQDYVAEPPGNPAGYDSLDKADPYLGELYPGAEQLSTGVEKRRQEMVDQLNKQYLELMDRERALEQSYPSPPKKEHKKGLMLTHQNIRSLPAKHTDLQILSAESQMDIIGLTETHLNEHFPDNIIQLPGYILLRKDRGSRHGGGIAMYIKDSLAFKERNDLCVDGLEALWIELTPPKSKHLLLCCAYRPPNDNNFFTAFRQSLEKASDTNLEVTIMGDLNCNLLQDKGPSEDLTFLCDLHDLTNLITEPTRVTENSSTLLDVILTSNPSKYSKSGVFKCGLSDHHLIYTYRGLKQPKPPPKWITARIFKRFDEEQFKKDLARVPWSTVAVFDSVQDMWSAWKSLFESTKQGTQPRKHKDQLTGKRTKKLRNHTKRLILSKKRNHYTDKINNGSVSDMWSSLKSLLGKPNSGDITGMKDTEGNTKTSPLDIAHVLNKYFGTVAETLAQNINKGLSHFSPLQFVRHYQSRFTLKPVSVDFVTQELLALKSDKATGLDQLNNRLLKSAAQEIAPSLTTIINASIQTSEFPEDWKNARLSPIHKAGDRDAPNNYRPISILPAVSKILERAVHTQLYDYMTTNNILSEVQSGFRPGHSTQTAVHLLTERWYKAMNEGELTGAVFIDLSKAFDTLDHTILLQKMSRYGIQGPAFDWFQSYLTGRKHCTSINGATSEFHQQAVEERRMKEALQWRTKQQGMLGNDGSEELANSWLDDPEIRAKLKTLLNTIVQYYGDDIDTPGDDYVKKGGDSSYYDYPLDEGVNSPNHGEGDGSRLLWGDYGGGGRDEDDSHDEKLVASPKWQDYFSDADMTTTATKPLTEAGMVFGGGGDEIESRGDPIDDDIIPTPDADMLLSLVGKELNSLLDGTIRLEDLTDVEYKLLAQAVRETISLLQDDSQQDGGGQEDAEDQETTRGSDGETEDGTGEAPDSSDEHQEDTSNPEVSKKDPGGGELEEKQAEDADSDGQEEKKDEETWIQEDQGEQKKSPASQQSFFRNGPPSLKFKSEEEEKEEEPTIDSKAWFIPIEDNRGRQVGIFDLKDAMEASVERNHAFLVFDRKVTYDDGTKVRDALADIIGVPNEIFSDISVLDNHVSFLVRPNDKGLNASTVAHLAENNKEALQKAVGMELVGTGIGSNEALVD
ncbi:Hypp5710 [Branchiostoma lanceolatum]|uniref:Hypp5710 protein n=1 Tax=Branchiostoma lanceolatum TaxID=7740 RepID=A0A8J9W796_BRALA|nr:Hypp5710 [Branchiostoma lanceolatum]